MDHQHVRSLSQCPTERNAKTSARSSFAGLPPSPENDDTHSIAESIGNQRNVLSSGQLLVAFPALALCMFVCYFDQTSVSTSIPAIAAELDTGAASSWIGASFLVSSVAFQLINGRLSDIFGRKTLLITCLVLLALGDLIAGFAKSPIHMFASRAVAGIGGGGLASLVMITVSDITTLENRGKYQGIIGATIALANGTGPFLGGVLVQRASWRWIVWIVPMLSVPSCLIVLFVLPLQYESGNYIAKVKKIDFGGILINLAGSLLILIPLTAGGVTMPWSSPTVVCMLIFGGIFSVTFVFYEWKIAKYPLMPIRLFQGHCSYLYAQAFLSGINFYGNFFYIPIYFQTVLGRSAMESGAFLLPLVVSHSLSSIISGQLMSLYHRYLPLVATGITVWTLGTGLKCTFDRESPIWSIIMVLIVEGFGIGFTLQPTLVALYANSRTEDRAVVTALRNFIRTMGGAFGLVASGTCLANTLERDLFGQLGITDEMLPLLTSSVHELKTLGLSKETREMVLDSYTQGLYFIFILYACCAGANLLLTFGIGNTSLKSDKNTPPQRLQQDEKESSGFQDARNRSVVNGEYSVEGKAPTRSVEEV